MVEVAVSSASKPPPFARGLPITIDVKPGVTVADVKASIAAKFPKFYPDRQKITVKGEKQALGDGVKVLEVLAGKGMELEVKDLGPQISWKVVFLVEYFGPLILHSIVYHFPRLWFGQEVQYSRLQKSVYALIMLHFIKRELETIFVHRFSHNTMPLMNIFRNSFHYWALGGLFIAVDVYRPKYSATSPYVANTLRDNTTFLWVSIACWAFAEISNFHTHMTLRNLRPEGTRIRKIPHGYGFTLLSCPNYFFETLTWLALSVMTNSVAAWVCLFFSVYTMTVWALKKHRNYKKEFGKEYPRGRKAIFPFIL